MPVGYTSTSAMNVQRTAVRTYLVANTRTAAAPHAVIACYFATGTVSAPASGLPLYRGPARHYLFGLPPITVLVGCTRTCVSHPASEHQFGGWAGAS